MPADPNAPFNGMGFDRHRPLSSKQIMQEMQDQSRDPMERMAAEDLTPEALCGAEQLAAARDFFMQAAGHKFISYKRGVECVDRRSKTARIQKMPKLPDVCCGNRFPQIGAKSMG